MKKVLWISRHQMTQPQYDDLSRILGEEIELLPWKETVQEIADLLPLLEQVDIIAAVLPTRLLADLVKAAGEKPVVQAVSGRVSSGRILTLPDGRQEQEILFVHCGWEQILRLELETKML